MSSTSGYSDPPKWVGSWGLNTVKPWLCAVELRRLPRVFERLLFQLEYLELRSPPRIVGVLCGNRFAR